MRWDPRTTSFCRREVRRLIRDALAEGKIPSPGAMARAVSEWRLFDLPVECTVVQAARALVVNVHVIYAAIRSGILPARREAFVTRSRDGWRWRLRRADVEAFAASLYGVSIRLAEIGEREDAPR